MGKATDSQESAHAQIQHIEAIFDANLQRIIKNVEDGMIDVDYALQEIKNLSKVHTLQMEALRNHLH